jgi:F-type H+-transporting ATPase subunit delta
MLSNQDLAVRSELFSPYADALLEIAQSQDLVDRFLEDADTVLSALNGENGSSDLASFLASPVFGSVPKKTVIQQVFGEVVHPTFLNLLQLMVDRNRAAAIEGACGMYRVLVRNLRNIVLAEVSSAVALTEEQHQQVIERVKAMTGAAGVEVETTIDPDLLGGVVIKVGSQVYDASLRGQLKRIAVSLGR